MIRIKLKPTKEQKEKLRKFADHARYTYNEAIVRLDGDAKLTKYDLRDAIVTGQSRDGVANPFFTGKSWLLDTPKVIRQQAAFEAKKNQKSAQSNKSAGNIKAFELKRKRDSAGSWTIGIERGITLQQSERRVTILPRCGIGQMGMYRHKKLHSNSTVPTSDCFIHRNVCGQYFIMMAVQVDRKSHTSSQCKPLAAVDPGLRKFVTTYSSDGACRAYGVGIGTRLWQTLRHIDIINADIAVTTGKARQRLQKKKLQLYQSIRNLQDELHYKTARWLTDSFSAIVLPRFSAKRCTSNDKSCLRAKDKRLLLAAGHFRFRERMIHKCQEAGVHLVLCDEMYTSKTCTRCLHLNNPGPSEIYKCNHCGFIADRDANAARNILLKNLEVFYLST